MKQRKLSFVSRDGVSRIVAVLYLPDDEKVKYVLQIVHGMAEYAERYEAVAEYFTSLGYAVALENHLGHGKTVAENDNGRKGYFCKKDSATVAVRDVHRLKKMVELEYPNTPYFILGHSMGSYIIRNYIARYGDGIEGAIIMGTGYMAPSFMGFTKVICNIRNFFCGEEKESKFLNTLAFSSYNKRIPNAKTPFDWLSVNEENVKKYIDDPLCGFLFTGNGFKTLFELIARACDKKVVMNTPEKLPLYIVSGAEDPVGGYGAGVKKSALLLIESGVKDVTVKLYDNDRHEILNEDDRTTVMKDIDEWINKHLVKE